MTQTLNPVLASLFDSLSPSTLAAIINDIQQLGTGADAAALDAERAAAVALDANCGPVDAKRYLAQAAMIDSAAYPVSVEYRVQWPTTFDEDGVRYWPTGKTGTNRATGCPAAEYQDSKYRRVWLQIDGTIVDD